MTALSADRKTNQRLGQQYGYPVAAGAKIFAGALVALNTSGYLIAGSATTGLKCVGRAEEYVDNTSGTNGAVLCLVKAGIFQFENSQTDALAQTNIGQVCYIEDDQTVCATATGKSVAGYMVDIDDNGVFVACHQPANANPSAACLTANNLSDVANAATARGNIAANKMALNCRCTDLVGANAKVYRAVSPVAGDIKKIHSILEGAALAAGNATITGSINGTPITGGAVTITQVGSAEGDVDTATPTAANTVAEGDAIELTVGGSNTSADAAANITLYIEY